MDIELQRAIKKYVHEPVDEHRSMLNALLQRAKLPSVEDVEAIRTVANAIINCRVGEGGFLPEIASNYLDFPYGVALNQPDDEMLMCDFLFRELPHPSHPADAMIFGPHGAEIYTAMLQLAGCPTCNQFVAGCYCAEPSDVCLDCGNYGCYGDCQGYPVQVGSGFGGPIAIWVHPDASQCGCRGSGWSSTDFDSWHQCPRHYHGQPHPEAY